MAGVEAEADFEGQVPIGTTLCEKWRVLRQLGRGGMSTVYEAEDPAGSRVAVKVLHERLARSSRTRERFFREGRLMNAVQHDDAVRMLDSREASCGRMLLVMELLDGQTLRRACESSGGTLEVEEVLRIGEAVLGVLSAAHAKGIVHRDIKPENVFLTGDGKVKVLDFGVAAIRDEALQDVSITQSGASLGTPAFMAPEQARGRQSQVDARTDIWALGATLFYCLTRRHVHQEALTANEALIFAATQPAAPLRQFRPDLAAEVGPIVDRALAFDPARRWQTAEAMGAAIRAAARHLRDGQATPSDLPSLHGTDTIEEALRFAPATRPRTMWLAAAVMVALGGATLVMQVKPTQDARADMARVNAVDRTPTTTPPSPERAAVAPMPTSRAPREEIAAPVPPAAAAPTAVVPSSEKRPVGVPKEPSATVSTTRASRVRSDDYIPDAVLNRRK
jgi:serine/threonine-protein kinase